MILILNISGWDSVGLSAPAPSLSSLKEFGHLYVSTSPEKTSYKSNKLLSPPDQSVICFYIPPSEDILFSLHSCW